ncbi:MAG: hypothetical protein ACO3FO_06675 [Candidatus Nanopelagicaceae bacterium]
MSKQPDLSLSSDTLALSDAGVPLDAETLNEIDEALHHASTTLKNSDYSQHQRDIVNQFIDDLLDTRLEKQC